MTKIRVLNTSTESVKYLKERDKRLSKLIDKIGDITYVPYQIDPFTFLLDTIIGQMLSKKAADCICQRVHDLCNGKPNPDSILKLTKEQLRSTGVSNSKSTYILNLANAVKSGVLDFNKLYELNDSDVIQELKKIQGIGNWSAKMYCIFVLDRQDILPYEDGAFLQSYCWLYNTDDRSISSIKKKCKKWQPYSSIASRYLYRALDSGLTKQNY